MAGLSTPDWLRQRAATTPRRMALIADGERWSFAELDLRVDAAAASLANRVCAGARVGIRASNSAGFVVAVHALMRLGAVLVPLNTRLTRSEVEWQQRDAEVSLTLEDADLAQLVELGARQLGQSTRPQANDLDHEKPAASASMAAGGADSSGALGRTVSVSSSAATRLNVAAAELDAGSSAFCSNTAAGPNVASDHGTSASASMPAVATDSDPVTAAGRSNPDADPNVASGHASASSVGAMDSNAATEAARSNPDANSSNALGRNVSAGADLATGGDVAAAATDSDPARSAPVASPQISSSASATEGGNPGAGLHVSSSASAAVPSTVAAAVSYSVSAAPNVHPSEAPSSSEHTAALGESATAGPEHLHAGRASAHPNLAERRFTLDACHTIIYTSGTTGRPKGAILTYANHWWSATASALNLGLLPDDTWLACLPLFHVGGLSILMRSVICGMTALVQPRFDAAEVNRAIDEEAVSIVSVVSTMLDRMLAERGTTPYPSSLRCVLLGGGPAPLPLLERAAALGVPVVQTYGLSETSSQLTTLAPEDALRKLGSAGKPLMGSAIRIGADGEILVRGPSVSPGYLHGTSRVDEDGWLHTGDLGYLDDEGYLYVLDRRNDLIVSGGENVYPAEVEAALLAHPAVLEAGVVGVPHPEWGRAVAAHVVLAPGHHTTVAELQAFCRDRLAGYKVPRTIEFRDSLPRNASGKLLRRELRID